MTDEQDQEQDQESKPLYAERVIDGDKRHAIANAALRRGGVIVWVDGRPFEFKSVPQCRVCQSPDREKIERGLLFGHSVPTIVNSLPAKSELWLDKDGNKRSLDTMIAGIHNHSKRGHSNLDAHASRAIMEHYAQRAGMDTMADDRMILTDLGLLDDVKRRGFAAMVSGDRKPTINQMLKAIELSLTFQDLGSEDSAEVFMEALKAVMEVLSDELPPDALSRVVDKLEGNPVIVSAFQSATAALEAGS